MSARAGAIAAAALALVGTRFRLHGRDPATGLDCVGLVALSLAAARIELPLPAAYGWRNTDCARWLPTSDQAERATAPWHMGDIVLARPGPAQHHLAVMLGPTGFVHAHAGSRRVVQQPGALPWPVLDAWRFA